MDEVMTIQKSARILSALSKCYYKQIHDGCSMCSKECNDCNLCYEKGTVGETQRACFLASNVLSMIAYVDTDGTIVPRKEGTEWEAFGSLSTRT